MDVIHNISKVVVEELKLVSRGLETFNDKISRDLFELRSYLIENHIVE